MKIRAGMFLAAILFSSLALASETVGSVYGKAVTAADIDLSAPIDPTIQFDGRDSAQWQLMRRIMTTFGQPIVERFIREKKIRATRDEITKFKNNFRKRTERNVASADESSAADLPDEMARMFIVTWKTERELHRVYGGRVIFQQAGPEALDARRRLFEDAEKKGDITFADAGVRHLFYYYANMSHTFIDEKALERPWFFEEVQ